jgi:hypothetical protein
MSWLDYLNPLSHMGSGEYVTFWQKLFATLLLGFWGRTIAVLLLILSFWYGVRRRNFIMGFWTFVLAGLIAYGAAIMKLFGLLV